MIPQEYQKRPSMFALKAIRLMVKTCLAQRIGADGVLLLTVIVSTEDAAHYRRPVDFWNEQLAVLCGFSLSKLKRVRERCVSEGWLNYRPGSKSRAATYFLTVPEYANGVGDSPTDEGHDSGFWRTGEPECEPDDQHSGAPVSQNPDGIRTECEPESGRNVSYILPPPNPNPPPPPPTPSAAFDAWAAAAAAMVDLGVESSPWASIDRAIARRTDPDTVRAGIEWFRQHAGSRGLGAGALANWVSNCGPGMAPDVGWPKPSPKVARRQQEAAVEKQRTEEEEADELRREADRQRFESLDRKFGRTLAAMSDGDLESLAASVSPFTLARLRTHGAETGIVRRTLLEALDRRQEATPGEAPANGSAAHAVGMVPVVMSAASTGRQSDE